LDDVKLELPNAEFESFQALSHDIDSFRSLNHSLSADWGDSRANPHFPNL
jgi:hypothetical protein